MECHDRSACTEADELLGPVRRERELRNNAPQQHGFGLWNRDGQIVLAVHLHAGMRFYDVTSIGTRLALLGEVALPSQDNSYFGVRWVSAQAPYFFAVARGNGLYVVDATDPTAPSLIANVPTGKLGGVSPSSVHAIGNLLLLSEVFGHGHATVDISDPAHPVLIESVQGASGYSHLFTAGLLLTPGGIFNANKMYVYEVGHDGHLSYRGEAGENLSEGGYGSYQDGYYFGGFGQEVAKFTIDPPALVGKGTSGIARRDEDFAHPIGNLILATDDHGVGTALIPHQAAPDTTGVEVVWMHPPADAADLPLTTRIGASVTDTVAVESLTADSFRVRTRDGTAVPGQLSVNQNNVNFSPDALLAASTTYDVEVCGLRDLAGNAGGCTAWSFATGGGAGSLPRPECRLDRLEPVETGAATRYEPTASRHGPTEYTWDFGNGETLGPQSTARATFTYTRPGRYPVILTVANAHGASRCSAVQLVHTPVTEVGPAASSSIIAVDTRGSALGVSRAVTNIYVANPDNGTVTRLFHDNSKVWEVAVGHDPRTLAEAPNGEIWVANEGSGDLAVLSPLGSIVRRIELGYGSAPYGVVFAPDGRAAYVTLGAGRLLKLDTRGTVVGELELGARPRGIAVSGDSTRILVTRFVSAFAESGAVGEVYEVDAASFTVARTIELGFNPGPDSEFGSRGVPNYLSQVRIAPDGATAWVPSKQDNIARGRYRDGQDLDFESQTRAIVSQIDLATGAEAPDRRIDFNDRDLAQALAFTPAGDALVVALEGSNLIELWDANKRTLLSGVEVGRAPMGLAFKPDGRRLYVHNFLDRSVTVLNTAPLLDGTSNQPTVVATVSTVAQEALAPAVLRGKRIFYDASDSRMNLDGYISCASCHLDGGSDGMVWDRTQFGEGLRNTIDLRGHRGTNGGFVHWTANYDEIQDFEHDMRNAFGGTGFMSDSDFRTGNRDSALGDPKAGLSAELDDLAAYVSSLERFPESPHREANGSLTAAGLAGELLFEQKGCAACHSGLGFTDDGVHDVGTIEASSGRRAGGPLLGINTPTLKGLWLAAPYLHNGKHPTLDGVLSEAEHVGGYLTQQEKDDLVAYLLQLDDLGLPPPPQAASPWRQATHARAVLTMLYEATDGPNWHNDTNWLSDAPLSEWYGLSRSPRGLVIELTGNGLNGSIPAELGALDGIDWLRLGYNRLRGPIPPELGNLDTLTLLDLSNNQLSGPIPPELGQLANLEVVSLDRNQLSGPVPAELWDMTDLVRLWLSNNAELSGSIPPRVANLVNLELLYLQQTSLAGPLPEALTELSSLTLLKFADSGLCAPVDAAFQTWAAALSVFEGPGCDALAGLGWPQVAVAAASSAVAEGTPASFTLTRSAGLERALLVTVNVMDIGVGSTVRPPAFVTFGLGEDSATLSVATADDFLVGAAREVRATIVEGPGYTAAEAVSAQVSVTDNDTATFGVSVHPGGIAEGETATLTVEVTSGVTFAADQAIALDFGGSTATGGADFTVSPELLALPAGARVVSALVTAVDDTEPEDAETVAFTALHGGAPIGTGTLTIAASDLPPLTGSFDAASIPQTHAGTGTFTLRIGFTAAIANGQAVLTQGLQVTGGALRAVRPVGGGGDRWEIGIEPASAAAMVVALAAGLPCHAPGAVCAPDGRPLSNRIEATIPGPPVPEVSIAAAASPVVEGTPAAFTLTRSGAMADTLTVAVSVTESGAVLAAEAPAAVTFAAGESTAALSLATVDDAVAESTSTVMAAITDSRDYTAAADAAAAQVSVEDNDAAAFAVSVNPSEITEGEAATLTVEIGNGVTFAEDQAIALDFSGSTATKDTDYTVSPESLILPAGAPTVAATVTAMDDRDPEGAETVTVAALHGGATVSTATLTIAASDAPLTARFLEMPARHDGSTWFSFELRFSEEFRISYRTLEDEAFQMTAGSVRGARRLAPPLEPPLGDHREAGVRGGRGGGAAGHRRLRRRGRGLHAGRQAAVEPPGGDDSRGDRSGTAGGFDHRGGESGAGGGAGRVHGVAHRAGDRGAGGPGERDLKPQLGGPDGDDAAGGRSAQQDGPDAGG